MAASIGDMAGSILPKLIPALEWGMVFFGIIVLTVAGVLLILHLKKRTWRAEIHEMKADGKLHTVDRDTLEEKKIQMGRKTVYWMKKGKTEAIPPPADTIDRFKGKEDPEE